MWKRAESWTDATPRRAALLLLLLLLRCHPTAAVTHAATQGQGRK